MPDNIVHIPVNPDYAKRGDPTTLAFLRQSLAHKLAEAQAEESIPWESVFPEAEPVTEMKRIGYMCAVDLEYHVGADISPSGVYSSPELAIEERKCVKSCGLVEVEITLKRYVIEPNYEGEEAESASQTERTCEDSESSSH